MILVDTSISVDHLRDGDPALVTVLEQGQALAHPWVTGELALGRLRDRAGVLQLLDQLSQAVVATAAELLAFIAHHKLFGLGIGYVDAQLLASARLTEDANSGPAIADCRPWPSALASPIRAECPPRCQPSWQPARGGRSRADALLAARWDPGRGPSASAAATAILARCRRRRRASPSCRGGPMR